MKPLMRMSTTPSSAPQVLGVALVAALLGGCGGGSNSPAPAPDPSTAGTPTPSPAPAPAPTPAPAPAPVGLACTAGQGTAGGISFYDPSNLVAYQDSTVANTPEYASLAWGAEYTAPAGSYTGSLVATLWAVPSSYSGGTISGYLLGVFVPNFTGPGAYSPTQLLAGGYSSTTIVSTTAYTTPPAGQYCVVATIDEYAPSQCTIYPSGLSGYCSAAWLQFATPATFQ